MHVKHISISLLGKKVKNRKLDSVVFVIWYSAQSQEQLVTVTAFFIVPALLTVTTLVTGTTLIIKVTSLVPVLTLFAFITHHK